MITNLRVLFFVNEERYSKKHEEKGAQTRRIRENFRLLFLLLFSIIARDELTNRINVIERTDGTLHGIT